MLIGQDPEKSALHLSCSEQETARNFLIFPTIYIMPLYWGYKWQLGKPEKSPQTTSETSNINALWGKNESDKLFLCELRFFPPKDHPV